MIAVIGILMIGGHFLFLAGIAQFSATVLPAWGMLFFLAVAVGSGLLLMRLQTLLEIYFISRHLKNKPMSGWNVLSLNHPKPKRA